MKTFVHKATCMQMSINNFIQNILQLETTQMYTK